MQFNNQMTSPHPNVNTLDVTVAGTSTPLPTPASSVPQASRVTNTTQSTMSAILQAHYRRAISYNHYTMNDYIEFAINLGWDSSSISWVTIDGQLGLSGWDTRTDSITHLSIERMKWKIYQVRWVPNRVKAYMAAYAAQQGMQASSSGQQPVLAPATGSYDGASQSGSVLPQNMIGSYATMPLAQHSLGLVRGNMSTTAASVPNISASTTSFPTPHSVPSSILSQIQWPTTSSQPTSDVIHSSTSSIDQQGFAYPIIPALIHQHASTSHNLATTANQRQYINKEKSENAPQAAGAMNHAVSHPAPNHHTAQSSSTKNATTHQNPMVDSTLEEMKHEAKMLSHSSVEWDVNEAIATVCNEEQTPEARRPSCLQLLSQEPQFLYTLAYYISGILGQEVYDALCEKWPNEKPQLKRKPKAVNGECQWNIETPVTMKEKPSKKRSRVEDNENGLRAPSSSRTIVQRSAHEGAATAPTSRASENGSRSSESTMPVAKRARVSQGDQVISASSNGVQSQGASEPTHDLSEKENVSPTAEGSSPQPTSTSDTSTASGDPKRDTSSEPEAVQSSKATARRRPAINAAACSAVYVPSPLAKEVILESEDEVEKEAVQQQPARALTSKDDAQAQVIDGEARCLDGSTPFEVPSQPSTSTGTSTDAPAPAQPENSTSALKSPQHVQKTNSDSLCVLGAANLVDGPQTTSAENAGLQGLNGDLDTGGSLADFDRLYNEYMAK
ncbi:hypothetical protein AX16_010503 [Volvariella volvacea WC 439]|nr:hypothetical protein AX16_010503 [Volvariella volvacea WC 439]